MTNTTGDIDGDGYDRNGLVQGTNIDADEITRLRVKLAETNHVLLTLLAVIHRDGGHYEAQHGTTKATEDALQVIYELRDIEERALQAEAQLAVTVGALEYFQQNGCPVCSGDCASANPPVLFCPMQALATLPARALAMAEVVKSAERLIADKSEVLKYASHYYKVSVEVMIDLVASLATYHAEPVSQSETDKG